MEHEERFKDLIVKHLGRKMKSKHREVLFNILIVDNNIKPGYLFDCASVSLDLLIKLINDMYSVNIINNKLIILIIGNDYVIVNPGHVFQLAQEPRYLQECVDVSASLQRPSLLKDSTVIQSAREIISKASINIDAVDSVVLPESTCNVTSLFGILLGYPVIYWFDTKDNKYENCLSMEPLRSVEVRGYFKSNKKGMDFTFHQIYAFSIPECILNELNTSIPQWFENVKRYSQWNKLFNKIELIEKTVTLPVVSM